MADLYLADLAQLLIAAALIQRSLQPDAATRAST
jgi:hypothetical protein